MIQLSFLGKPFYYGQFNSKLLVQYLKKKFGNFGSYVWDIPKTILNSSPKIKFAFIRGLFDSEGSFKRRNLVSFVSANKRATLNIKKILEKNGIKCILKVERRKNRAREYYVLRISSFMNVLKFAQKVNFTISNKKFKLLNYLREMDLRGYNVPNKF